MKEERKKIRKEGKQIQDGAFFRFCSFLREHSWFLGKEGFWRGCKKPPHLVHCGWEGEAINLL